MKHDKNYRFAIIESTADGTRTIVDTFKKLPRKNSYEVCGYAPTKLACMGMMFWLRPSKYLKNI